MFSLERMSGSYESGATLRRMNWQRVLGPIKNEYPELNAVRLVLTLCLRLANAFHVSVDTLLEGVVEYEMVQTLLNDTSEQLLAQELLQVVKRYIREAEK